MENNNISTENTAQPGAAPANAPASQSAPGSASQGTQEVPEWFKPYAAKLDAGDKVVRAKQSEADKIIAASNKKTKQDIENTVATVSRIQNLDEQQTAALRNQLFYEEMQSRAFASDGQQATANPASLGSRNGDAATLDELTILKSFNFREDEDTLAVMREADGDPSRLIAGFNQLALRRASSPQPTPAAVPVPSGGSALAPQSRDALKAGYTSEMQAARGNREQVLAVQAKYRAQNLDIENIGFLT